MPFTGSHQSLPRGLCTGNGYSHTRGTSICSLRIYGDMSQLNYAEITNRVWDGDDQIFEILYKIYLIINITFKLGVN